MNRPRVVHNFQGNSRVMQDPESKASLESWHWSTIWAPSLPTYEDHIGWTLQAVEPLLKSLRTPNCDLILMYWGEIPSDWGLLTVANALLGNRDGPYARFYIEPVECMAKGPGYVYGQMSIEYLDGFMDLLIQKARHAFGGGASCLSFYFLPPERFEEVAHSMFFVGSPRPALTPGEKRLLEICDYMVVLDVDCDVIEIGAKGPGKERVLAVLKELWPEAVYGER